MKISETFRKAAANILNNPVTQCALVMTPPLVGMLTAQHYLSNLDPVTLYEIVNPLNTFMNESPHLAIPLYGTGFMALGFGFLVSTLAYIEGSEYVINKAAQKLDPKPSPTLLKSELK